MKKTTDKTHAWLLSLLVFVCVFSGTALAAPTPLQSVAFYYGEAPAWRELQAFDLAVVEPEHVKGPLPALPKTRIAAYVSVGEVHASRIDTLQIPPQWLAGDNRAWDSRVIDQSQTAWPAFFVDRLITPLWDKGYRTFFLDTLDAFQLVAKTPEQRAAQEAGLVAVIHRIKQRYPSAQLIFNRGFEILDRTHEQAMAVVAESLFEGYDAGNRRYRPVPEQDRDWLRGQLKRVRDEYRLPVIVIDYLPAVQREQARQTARKIEAEGFIPWVTTGELTTLGVGSIEVMPRRVLLVHEPLPYEHALRESPVVRFATMPLNHLGYAAEYVDTHHLPARALAGHYAGVVVWLNDTTDAEGTKRLSNWLKLRVEEGVPVALVNQIDGLLDSPLARVLGLERGPLPGNAGSVTIIEQDAMTGFERKLAPRAHEFFPLSLAQGRPLLTLGMGKARQVAAAIAPWGGYVMWPYALNTLPNISDNRWLIDPFAFFQAALRLPDMPVPDMTTESGRRMLMVHMDGDGFVSRSELAGNPYAGEVVRDRVVKKYRLPMTISVIEAELSPQGLHPELSARLEPAARDIFRVPQVEIASHSYSHPFNWRMAAKAGDDESQSAESAYNLPVPGYQFNLQREIEGSIRYIETRLAPPGKKVALFLWTGNCIPGRDALEWTQKLGVQNMNGGDTTITRSRNTLTQVEGLGVERNGLFQVFAPNQNENVYTHDWTGPFYGFERLIETFELTETPRRLKPMNIYFHTYIATKRAGMQSLDKVFSHALKQENTPVFSSEYARKVLDFRDVVIARTATGWRVRGMKNLHTLRLLQTPDEPDLTASTGIAGWRDQGRARYVHVAAPDGTAELKLAPANPALPVPRLVSANARIQEARRDGNRLRWQLAGHVPIEFTLTNASACRVQVQGRPLVPTRREGTQAFYRLNDHVAQPLEAICQH